MPFIYYIEIAEMFNPEMLKLVQDKGFSAALAK